MTSQNNPASGSYYFTLVMQIIFLLLGGMILDGGGILLIVFFATVSYWGEFSLIRFRRGSNYSKQTSFCFGGVSLCFALFLFSWPNTFGI